ncbi:MAG: response regulator [bacterium]|nr:response regulator [bacterium]MDT8364858.1 response regulator [bacterium]
MSSASHTGPSSIVIKCEGCEKAYKIHREKLPSGISSFPCRACGTHIPIPQAQVENVPEQGAERVLVVVEEEELGKLIQRILDGNGYRGHLAFSGKEALNVLKEGEMDLLLTNVYLPDMMGYELFDKVSSGEFGPGIPSILLSAVHHVARYKRAPTTLYGADDYLERHHLSDLLIPKIRRLLSPNDDTPGKITPADVPPPTDDQVQDRRDLETMENAIQPPEVHQMGAIQRMCRVIVGDIALYNEDVISSTSPESLLDAIASDLREGESLLMNKFPEMEDQLSPLLRGEMLRLLNSRGIQVS